MPLFPGGRGEPGGTAASIDEHGVWLCKNMHRLRVHRLRVHRLRVIENRMVAIGFLRPEAEASALQAVGPQRRPTLQPARPRSPRRLRSLYLLQIVEIRVRLWHTLLINQAIENSARNRGLFPKFPIFLVP